VHVRRFDSVAAFAERARPFLERREAEHNLLLGLLGRLLRDPHLYGEHEPYLAVAESGEAVIAVALRTPPHNLILSESDDEASAEAFAADLAGETLPGLLGPASAAERFATAWGDVTGARPRIAMRERIYEALEATPPSGVPGRSRRYRDDDHDLVVAWLEAFIVEAMSQSPMQEDAAAIVARRAADPDGDFVLWEDGGEPVSFAGFGSPTPHGIRIGPVYTPPERRGLGYASALVGGLTAQLLAGGRRFCFLFTDLANPTSNAIYVRVGYRPVTDVNQWTFDSP